MASALHLRHLVVPGQVIATSDGETDTFLRGHGTYVETVPTSDDAGAGSGLLGGTDASPSPNVKGGEGSGGLVTMEDEPTAKTGDGDQMDTGDGEPASTQPQGPQRLVASVAGTVERVNKLISVVPVAPSLYGGQVGDLVVGRVSSVGGTRWKVSLTCSPPSGFGGGGGGGGSSSCRDGQLPLSGVNLPGGVQRIRTSEDALTMRSMFREGDLVSAEVQSVQHDGTLLLHTRSLRYGKLENGVLITVPPALVPRRKIHFVSLDRQIGVDVLLGCNGAVWIQRTVPQEWEDALKSKDEREAGAVPLAETLQKLRQRHAATPVLPEERENIARVRNSIDCLRLVYCRVTPETIGTVYKASIEAKVRVGDMLRPEMVVRLTAGTRK